LFASEISSGFDTKQFSRSGAYTLTGDGISHGRTEIVIEEFLLAASPRRSELHLVLRLHPKHSRPELASYLAQFDTISDVGAPHELVFAADAVVGMTSMLLVEAALLRRPTLAIVPRREEMGWLPTIAAGITPVAMTRPAIAEQLAKLIDNPRSPTDETLDQLFPPGAAKRVAAAIKRCVRQ
jgi:hypothetical protein